VTSEETRRQTRRHELMTELLPDSALYTIEDAGHLPTLEQPKITTATQSHWLEET